MFWDAQGLVFYDIAGGLISDLPTDRGFGSTDCLFNNASQPHFFDQRADPPAGDGYYYLARAQAAGNGSFGDGKTDGEDPRNALDLDGPCQ